MNCLSINIIIIVQCQSGTKRLSTQFKFIFLNKIKIRLLRLQFRCMHADLQLAASSSRRPADG
jgi:hypothetical protein